MSRINYNTKQKEQVLEFFENNSDKLFSVKEILEVNKENIGQTTIYRIIESLVKEEKIKVFNGGFGKMYGYFPCDKKNHYNLICTKCGEITHVDCERLSLIEAHILEEHNFKLYTKEIFLKGRCSKCQ